MYKNLRYKKLMQNNSRFTLTLKTLFPHVTYFVANSLKENFNSSHFTLSHYVQYIHITFVKIF